MSTSPRSPLDDLFPGLSADQLIAEEQDHEDTEFSAPSTLGKRTSPSGGVDTEDEDEGNGRSLSPEGESSPNRPSSVTRPNSGMLEMDQAIRRTAKRLKLSNENISLVEKFTQVSLTSPPLETN
jgi:hypothetical protein